MCTAPASEARWRAGAPSVPPSGASRRLARDLADGDGGAGADEPRCKERAGLESDADACRCSAAFSRRRCSWSLTSVVRAQAGVCRVMELGLFGVFGFSGLRSSRVTLE